MTATRNLSARCVEAVRMLTACRFRFCSCLIVFSILGSPCLASSPVALPLYVVGNEISTANQTSVDDPQAEQDEEPNTKEAQPKISDQFAQLYLQDGSILGGELSLKNVRIKTEFGTLTVPLRQIQRIIPGVGSNPELQARIQSLVNDLGAPKLDTRDAAEKELIALGPKIRMLLLTQPKTENAERNKRLTKILATIDERIEAIEELGEDLEVADQQLQMLDTIVTEKFTIAGEILDKEFGITSKFGTLQVKLGDINLAKRDIGIAKPIVRKSVKVGAMAFFQTSPQNTRIRVRKGDKILVRAEGVVQWTNWNSSSTPDGITNRGQWNSINSGKLVARIGSDNSQCVAVGSKGEFTAKANGTLYLGIAMRDSYASNSGYRWVGDYKAKITIKPSNK